MTPAQRAATIARIIAWQQRDAFWTLPQVAASRRAWLERLADDELEREAQRYRDRAVMH